MKLTFLFLLLTLTLFAQDRKGSVYLSGNTAAEYSRLSFSNFRSVYTPLNALQRFEGLRFNSQSGYFLTNRLVVGSRVNYFATPDIYNDNYSAYDVLTLSPFVRYYFLDGAAPKTSFFGEAGFGTVGFGKAEDFKNDYHLGVGAERRLAAGILGTARLNYTADAKVSGASFTDLTLGLNVLTGQLAPATADAPVTAGTFSATGQLGRATYGNRTKGDYQLRDVAVELSPRIGYFVLNGLLLEADVTLTYLAHRYRSLIQDYSPYTFRNYSLDASLQARYYILQHGRMLPYVGAGIGYVRTSYRYAGDSYEQKQGYASFPWKAAAGASFFLSPQLAIDLAAGYARGRAESLNDLFGYAEGSERQLQFSTGLRFFLARE